MRASRLWPALAALALAAAACGGSSGPQRHTAKGLPLSLETPSGWKSISAEDVAKPDFLDRLRKQSAVLADAVAPLEQSNTVVRLIVLDPHVTNKFASNVVVTKEPVPASATLSQYATATADSIRRAGLTRTIDRADVALPVGPAVRLRYSIDVPSTKGGRLTSATEQYLFVHDGSGYVVTFTTKPETRARYAPIFLTSARSIRFD